MKLKQKDFVDVLYKTICKVIRGKELDSMRKNITTFDVQLDNLSCCMPPPHSSVSIDQVDGIYVLII